MKTTLFLGAGASAFANLPTTKDLLQLLRSRLQKHGNNPKSDTLLQDYVEHIVGAKVYTDVEKLYDGIETIIAIRANPNCKPISEGFRYYYDGVKTTTTTVNLNSLIYRMLWSGMLSII